MVFGHTSYRTFLREILVERIHRNPRYSLRAMAQQLGFSHSSLSEVLNGKANFSQNSGRKLAAKLDLSPDETEYLVLLTQLETLKDPIARASVLDRLRALAPMPIQIRELTADQFKQAAEWYHSAILELLFLDDFVLDAGNASEKLGISKDEAALAIERLVRLGLLQRDESGTLRRSPGRILSSVEVPSEAKRKFCKKMLEMASEALDAQPSSERAGGYETFPISKAALPEARQILEDCFTKLVALSYKNEPKTDVYHVSMHLFNLTPERKSLR